MGPYGGQKIGVWRCNCRRQTFVTMICERGGTYQPKIRKLKRDDIGSRKCK